MGITGYIIAALGLIIVLGGAASGFYYYTTQDQLAALNTKLGIDETQIATDKITISDYKNQLAVVQKANEDYNNQLNTIRSQATKLQAQLRALNLKVNAAVDPRDTEKALTTRHMSIFNELAKINQPVGVSK